MVAANDDSTSRFVQRNAGWDDLPPKRRRFYLWLIISWLLLPLGRIPLEMAGLSSLVAAWVIVGLTVLILVPLGWIAWQELKQRREAGEELPPAPVKGRTVAGWVVATLLLWSVVIFVAATSSEPWIPFLPIACAVITGLRFRQWRRQKTGSVDL